MCRRSVFWDDLYYQQNQQRFMISDVIARRYACGSQLPKRGQVAALLKLLLPPVL